MDIQKVESEMENLQEECVKRQAQAQPQGERNNQFQFPVSQFWISGFPKIQTLHFLGNQDPNDPMYPSAVTVPLVCMS